MKRTKLIRPMLFALALGACDLDFTDPNAPPEDLALTTTAGIRQVAIGLQAEYGNQLVDPVYVVGLVTNEIGAAEASFESFMRADRGDELTPGDGPAVHTWAGVEGRGGQYRVIRAANALIDNAPGVGFGPGMTSGFLALGKLYKGMAFGNLYQIYERVPLNVGPHIPDPTFAPRAEVIAEVLRLLEEARQQVTTTAPPAEFRAEVLAEGFDLQNTINAMLARYYLIAGNLDQALTAAQRVNLGVLSEHRFSTADVNPLWNLWYNSGNAYRMRAKRTFRQEAEAGDQRVAYWVEPEAEVPGVTGPLDHIERYQTSAVSFPIYLPGEMRLIIAEVHARQDRLADALEWVNAVRTQCSSPVNEPLACLPALEADDVPTQAAILAEILRQRRYELYLQGLRWSDLRRFDQPMKYQFMPVPSTECARNPNTPQELCQPVGG